MITSLPALQKLAEQPLMPKTLYWVSKLLSKLDKDVDFFNNGRNKLIKELGDEINGNQYRVREENYAEFNRRLEELLEVDIDIDFKTVKLPTSENITLSYNDLRMLEGFVELELIEEK